MQKYPHFLCVCVRVLWQLIFCTQLQQQICPLIPPLMFSVRQYELSWWWAERQQCVCVFLWVCMRVRVPYQRTVDISGDTEKMYQFVVANTQTYICWATQTQSCHFSEKKTPGHLFQFFQFKCSFPPRLYNYQWGKVIPYIELLDWWVYVHLTYTYI